MLIVSLILKWQDKGMTKVKQTSSNVKNLEKLSYIMNERLKKPFVNYDPDSDVLYGPSNLLLSSGKD